MMTTAIDIACRACASQPGEKCRTARLDLVEYQEEFHQERVIDAETMMDGPQSERGEELADEAVDRVVGKELG